MGFEPKPARAHAVPEVELVATKPSAGRPSSYFVLDSFSSHFLSPLLPSSLSLLQTLLPSLRRPQNE